MNGFYCSECGCWSNRKHTAAHHRKMKGPTSKHLLNEGLELAIKEAEKNDKNEIIKFMRAIQKEVKGKTKEEAIKILKDRVKRRKTKKEVTKSFVNRLVKQGTATLKPEFESVQEKEQRHKERKERIRFLHESSDLYYDATLDIIEDHYDHNTRYGKVLIDLMSKLIYDIVELKEKVSTLENNISSIREDMEWKQNCYDD